MAAQSYSMSQRGGGRGETGRMRAAIVAKIDSWVQNANWQDSERAERMLAKLHEAPEKYVSPNPDASHKEEASRIYGELKDEFGLRTQREAQKEARDLKEKAERHYDKKEREAETEPEPEPESDPDPEPEPGQSGETAADGAEAETVREAVETVETGTEESAAETDTRGTGDGQRSDETGFSWLSFGRWLERRAGVAAGRGLRTLAGLVWSFMVWFVPVAGRSGKRAIVLLARVIGFVLGISLRTAVFVAGLVAAALWAFGRGAVTGATA